MTTDGENVKSNGNCLVSIGMPVYNGELFVSEAIKSILNQSFGDFELIICDNASTDRTDDICRNFAKGDERIRYYRNKRNVGAAKNYNNTFALSKGKYFKWASHDDLCGRNFLKCCVEKFESSPDNVVLCYPKTLLIDEKGKDTGKYEHKAILGERASERLDAAILNFGQRMCNPVFGLMRSDAVRETKKIGSFPAADVIFLAEMSLRGKFCEVGKCLFLRRVHPGMSRLYARSADEAAEWIDPETKGKFFLLRCRFFYEYLKAIGRAKLGYIEKCACVRVVMRDWFLRYWRDMGGECKILLKHKLIKNPKQIQKNKKKNLITDFAD